MTKTKRKLNVKRAVIVGILVVAFIVTGLGLGFAFGVLKNLPDPATDFNPDATTFIHDMDGKEVTRLHGAENRIPVDLEAVPQDLKDAFISTEDRDFYKHPGINVSAFLRAAIANMRAGSIVQGGSTITMQLVENAYFADNPSRTYTRKLQEAFMALQMERHYTKDEIFEAYMNQIYFGHGAYGVQAASQTYFGKDVKDLTLAESAMIAGVTNNPSAFSPFNNEERSKQRQAIVLNNMVASEMISSSEAEAAKEEEIDLSSGKTEAEPKKYPYYVDAVILEAEKLLEEQGMAAADVYRGGLHIYTSLDVKIQEKMQDVYDNSSNFPSSPGDEPVQGAMVMMDPGTGEVRGLIGGREHTVERGLNRAVQSQRQPGSVIKPLVAYGPAVENGSSPGTVIDDVPVTYGGGGGSKAYSPGNYDGRFRGLITMRTAVAYSVNIPAVKTLERIGIETGYNFGKDLGLSLVSADKGLSLALGGLTHGVTPLEIAGGYSAFANGGVFIEPHTIVRITDKNGETLFDIEPEEKQVMSEETAFMITDMLKSVVTSGTGTRAQIGGHEVAGKTGTTQLPDLPAFKGKTGERDSWFVGYTPELVGVVWLGYDKTTSTNYLRGAYGGTTGAPIWRQVMVDALRHTPSRTIEEPDGIVWASIDTKSGKLPSNLTPSQFISKEPFAKGTVPTEISDVWITAEVCSESKMLPASFCPRTETRSFLKRPVPYTGSARPEDANLELSSAKCTIHGSGEGIQLKVCTDPRHNGELYLANVPKPGGSGGCPDRYVEIRTFALDSVPGQHCNLDDHQVTAPTGGDGGDNNDSGSSSISLRWSASGSGVSLSWNNIGSGNVVYSVVRWSSKDSSKVNVGTTKRNSWSDSNLESGTTYYYQVQGNDSSSSKRTNSNTVSISR